MKCYQNKFLSIMFLNGKQRGYYPWYEVETNVQYRDFRTKTGVILQQPDVSPVKPLNSLIWLTDAMG